MATINPILMFDSRFDDGTPVASSTAAGFDVLNLRDRRNYTWYKPGSLPATAIVDCGIDKAADCLAVYGHDLGSKGCTIEARGSTDNFSASDVLLASATPANDKPFLVQFNSAPYRSWGVRITGPAAPSMAIVMLGAALVFPQPVENGFDPIGPDLLGNIDVARNGNPIGRTIEHQSWKQKLRFPDLAESWVRANWVTNWSRIRDKPVLFAWDSQYHPEDIYLAVLGNGFDAPYKAGARTDLGFELSGLSTL
ncbi:MAG: hypothetical protein ACOY4U_04465 [Pseudomonadota bacterium]